MTSLINSNDDWQLTLEFLIWCHFYQDAGGNWDFDTYDSMSSSWSLGSAFAAAYKTIKKCTFLTQVWSLKINLFLADSCCHYNIKHNSVNLPVAHLRGQEPWQWLSSNPNNNTKKKLGNLIQQKRRQSIIIYIGRLKQSCKSLQCSYDFFFDFF